jgi:hypothetical protein
MRTPFVKVHHDLEKNGVRSRLGSQGVVTEGMLLKYISYVDTLRTSFEKSLADCNHPHISARQLGQSLPHLESPFDFLSHVDST